MASEDSDKLVSGFAVIHRLSDANDLDQTVASRMSTRLDHLHARRELLEVTSLRCTERMPLEERYDRLHQLRPSRHNVLAQMLLMIVVALVDENPPNPEEALELLEAVQAPHSLRHGKLVAHLIAGYVAFAPRTVWLPHEAD